MENNIAKIFFMQELARINHNIQHLHMGAQHGGSDNVSLLLVQQRYRVIAQALANGAGNLMDALELCHSHLLEAEQRHTQVVATGGSAEGPQADIWWDTYNELEYLADLTRRFYTFVRKHDQDNGC